MAEDYKRKYVFGMDFGTSDFKFGHIELGEVPEVIENRGYFPDRSSAISAIMGTEREVIVGEDVPKYLEAREDLAQRLVYPMRDGVIEKNDRKSWKVVKEIVFHSLSKLKPSSPDFEGFYVVSSLSVVAPRYMYETMFEIFKEAAERGLVKAATIIPQPLAVAIAHKIPTCVVVEGGHGNSQICPISTYPIRNAITAINRGGAEANALTAEILKDAGYSDLAKEESVVRRVKESIGVVPRDLEEAIKFSKQNPERVHVKYKIPGTRITIDLGEQSWARFLIGEFVFDPNQEVFQSYFVRGLPKPKDVKIGDVYFHGMMDMAESIIQSVERCPAELQPHLYKQVLLSGGNFAWKVPKDLEGIAVGASIKVKEMMARKGIEEVSVRVAENPQFSVWRGCIVYGYAVPESYSWSWEKMEGWVKFS